MGSIMNGPSHLSKAFGAPLPTPIPTLRQLLRDVEKKYPERISLISMYQPATTIPISFPSDIPVAPSDNKPYIRWTHAQIYYAARVLASSLRSRGTKKGDSIAAFLYNGVEWVIVAWAAFIMRSPLVLMNPKGVGNSREVDHMLKISETKCVIAADVPMAKNLDPLLSKYGVEERFVTEKGAALLGDGWADFYELFKSQAPLEEDQEEQPPDELILICFTSGSTALPKGAIHTATSLSAAMISMHMALQMDYTSRGCVHMPTFHIAGFNMSIGFQAAGGSAVFPSASFDAGASLDAIDQEEPTNICSVPSIIQAMAAHPKIKTTNTSSLRNFELGATTILLECFHTIADSFHCKSAANAYASTECVPVTFSYFDTRTIQKVTVGKMCAGARLKVCEPDSKILVPRGQPGELHCGGPFMVKGYLAGASPDSFYEDEDGRWWISGDQGIMDDDGSLTISGRYKDMIIRGGENIAPAAIEAALDSRLGIFAQVVGVRSEEAGEVPIAIVQPKEGLSVKTSTIRNAVLEDLGPAFVPEKVYELKDIGLTDYPRTSTGKVQKVNLREIVQAHENRIEEAEVVNPIGMDNIEAKLTKIWQKVINIDADAIGPDASMSEFADSLTIMRFRNRIKRELGFDITIQQLLETSTIKAQAALISSVQSAPVQVQDFNIYRDGPPGTDDIALTLGNPLIKKDIEQQVSKSLEPYGFSWEDDVEDVLPSWDLGYEVFGSVAGIAKVNHRIVLSTRHTSVKKTRAAFEKVLKHHGMMRSFELRGLNDEPTMRVIVRANEKWFNYCFEEIPEVESPEELVRLIEDGVHFSEVEPPYPSFLIRLAHLKSTNTTGILWATQHSAFDGLSMFSFLEDLDAVLASPHEVLKPHVPYKLWADTYYLHRTSLTAQRSVNIQVRRLNSISNHTESLFPLLPAHLSGESAPDVTQRKSYLSRLLQTHLPTSVSSLRSDHNVPIFILMKAALSLFLANKTKSGYAVFSQNENGRTWPFQEPWLQSQLPQGMDIAGPTLERTVSLVPVSTEITVLDFLKYMQADQEEGAEHVHAPWNLVRKQLGTENAKVFDAACERTCLNWLPIRMRDGTMVFNEMRYYETKANCETWFLVNCGVEEGGRLWVQVYVDTGYVSREQGEAWARGIMRAVNFMGESENWTRSLGEVTLGEQEDKDIHMKELGWQLRQP